MVVLDMLYHLAGGTAVHLLYVLVKFFVIFLVTFLTAHFVGRSTREGWFTTISGPIIFYLYYRFANPTLNREVFVLDEQFWFVFAHIAMMVISYFGVYYFVFGKKDSIKAKSIVSVFVLALLVIGIDILYQLTYVHITTGGNEEENARALHFEKSFNLFALVFLLGLAAGKIKKHPFARGAAFAAAVSIAIYLTSFSMPRAFFGIVSGALPYWLLSLNFRGKR
ncbi:hypothetical protein HYU14_02365 [Candidatus Woesearchaeota archaeon]|nr:hypothetical protein [Candidatus Woesearchaeota archaeon]